MGSSGLKRILLVEDERDISELVVITLEAVGGFKVLACESGTDALAQAKEFAPDLLILDVMMPEMDGPTVLMELWRRPALANTPAIFLTAKVGPSETERLKSLGAADVISKPFDPMKLPGQVEEIWTGATRRLENTRDRQDLSERRDRLREEFLARTVNEKATLEKARRTLSKGANLAPAELESLHFLVHRLAGSAASFGYPELGKVAGEIDCAITAEDKTRLAEQIERLLSTMPEQD